MKYFFVWLLLTSAVYGSSDKNPCHDFVKYIPMDHLKAHEGVCLIEHGFKSKAKLNGAIKFIWPMVQSNGRSCDVKDKECPTFMVFSWDWKASIGVILSKESFKASDFRGSDIEPTLTYIREKTGVRFRREI